MLKQKKNISNRILIAVTFCTINIFGFLPENLFSQIVTNGGFENSTTGIVSGSDIEGWLIQSGSVSPAPELEIVSDTVKEGTRALKVTVHGLGTNAWDIQVISDSIPAIQGTTYNYSIWAKAAKAGAQVSLTAGNYSYTEYKALRPVNLTTEWKKYTMQFTVDDDVTYMRAPIHFNYAADTNNAIYIDDLQIIDDKFGKTPVFVEAESGLAGSHFTTNVDGEITYVTTDTNYTGMASPGAASRIISYEVTFQDSGYYNLFARLRVGPGGFNDDSFFAGKGFGSKNDTAGTDWVFVNGLGGAGFTKSTDVVEDLGIAGSEVWKWVNISKNFFPGDTAEKTFFVSLDELTKTFQIGSREDGLYFDKFAFGKSYLFYTVEALDSGLAGTTSIEEFDSSKFYQGPPYAEGKSKFLGNAYGDIPDYVFANYWNQLTPGNAGKWGSVASVQDSTKWNWTGLDRAYNYAVANNLIFKNHTLIWGQQQPSWISALDTATQKKYIETWIKKVGERYPKIDMIDVVNEALPTHNPPDGGNERANYKAALGGNGTTGWDWVINSFALARKYMPDAKLLINDYGIINDITATTNYLQIINLLNDRGLIDGIGVQGHRFEFESANLSTLKSNLDRLAATGLPVYISEFDLGNVGNTGTPDDAQQLQLYKSIFPVLWLHPGVKGITLWGYLEGQMWQETCYLVLADGTSRPALDWLANYVDTASFPPAENSINELISDKNLYQNFPNPFSVSTNIKFTLARSAYVNLKIYDLLGREIETLVNENLPAGEHKITWDAGKNGNSSIESGTYYFRLTVGDDIITKKMLLIK